MYFQKQNKAKLCLVCFLHTWKEILSSQKKRILYSILFNENNKNYAEKKKKICLDPYGKSLSQNLTEHYKKKEKRRERKHIQLNRQYGHGLQLYSLHIWADKCVYTMAKIGFGSWLRSRWYITNTENLQAQEKGHSLKRRCQEKQGKGVQYRNKRDLWGYDSMILLISL